MSSSSSSYWFSSSYNHSYYYDHPFSYTVRRPSALTRVGTRLFETLGLASRRHNLHEPGSAPSDLHDMALTAQPPLLSKRAHTRRRRPAHRHDSRANWTSTALRVWEVTEDVIVVTVLTVAAGLLLRAAVRGVSTWWPFATSTGGNRPSPRPSNENDKAEDGTPKQD